MEPPQPAHLEPSELGTKEYWDDYYKADLTSTPSPMASLDGWFSDSNATTKILDFLTGPNMDLDLQSTTFLDLGTGNGEMLFLLREEGDFEGTMVGIDYSSTSIELARKIAAAKSQTTQSKIAFEVWDIVHSDPLPSWKDGFDVVLDKGTFDAVSLAAETGSGGRRICEGYSAKVQELVKPGGFLLVTSCNWTEEELEAWFSSTHSQLKTFSRISYPSFSFGGQSGQSISTLCFKRAD